MPAQPLLRVLTQLRQQILDPDALVRAVASGRRQGATPRWRRVELRYVDLKAGRRLQVTAYDDAQAHTSNHEPGEDARAAVDALLDEPFGNWHVDTTTQSHQVRVTKKGDALLHTRRAGRRGRGGSGPRPRQGPAAAGGRPGVRGARALRPRGPDEAEPAGEVPPGRGVPAHPGRLDHRRDRQGPPAPPDRGGAAADGRPRLRQRVPDLRGRSATSPTSAACPSS